MGLPPVVTAAIVAPVGTEGDVSQEVLETAVVVVGVVTAVKVEVEADPVYDKEVEVGLYILTVTGRHWLQTFEGNLTLSGLDTMQERKDEQLWSLMQLSGGVHTVSPVQVIPPHMPYLPTVATPVVKRAARIARERCWNRIVGIQGRLYEHHFNLYY